MQTNEPDLDAIALERKHLHTAAEELLNTMLEALLHISDEGVTYFRKKAEEIKAGAKMPDVWWKAHNQTLVARDAAKTLAFVVFNDGSVLRNLKLAIEETIEAIVKVRTQQNGNLFSEKARVRILHIFTFQPVSHYANGFARLNYPGAPTAEDFHELFYPEVWANYQVLATLLKNLVTDGLERAEINGLSESSRSSWMSLGVMLQGINGTEYAIPERSAIELLDGIERQDRLDKTEIFLRTRKGLKPKPLPSLRKLLSQDAQEYAYHLWLHDQRHPEKLSHLAHDRGIELDLKGRKVNFDDVYNTHAKDRLMLRHNIQSRDEFVNLIRARQARTRRANAEED